MLGTSLLKTDASHIKVVASWPKSQRDCDLWSGNRVRFPVDLNRISDEISFDGARNYTLIQDGDVLAFAQIYDRSRGRGHLARIIVDPARRGQGFGKLLIQLLVAEARACGHRAASLNVHKDNERATQLYRTLGFREVERPSEDPDVPECWYMEHSL